MLRSAEQELKASRGARVETYPHASASAESGRRVSRNAGEVYSTLIGPRRSCCFPREAGHIIAATLSRLVIFRTSGTRTLTMERCSFPTSGDTDQHPIPAARGRRRSHSSRREGAAQGGCSRRCTATVTCNSTSNPGMMECADNAETPVQNPFHSQSNAVSRSHHADGLGTASFKGSCDESGESVSTPVPEGDDVRAPKMPEYSLDRLSGVTGFGYMYMTGRSWTAGEMMLRGRINQRMIVGPARLRRSTRSG